MGGYSWMPRHINQLLCVRGLFATDGQVDQAVLVKEWSTPRKIEKICNSLYDWLQLEFQTGQNSRSFREDAYLAARYVNKNTESLLDNQWDKMEQANKDQTDAIKEAIRSEVKNAVNDAIGKDTFHSEVKDSFRSDTFHNEV